MYVMQAIHPTNQRRRSSIDFGTLTNYRIGGDNNDADYHGHDDGSSGGGSIIGKIVSSRASSIFNLLDPSKSALDSSIHSVDRCNINKNRPLHKHQHQHQHQPIGTSIQERHESLSGSWTPDSLSNQKANSSSNINIGPSRPKGLSRSCPIQRSNSIGSSSFNSNPNHYFSASDRAHRIAQNTRLQELLTHEVKKSGSFTGAGYKAVLQEFLYSHEVEEEMARNYASDMHHAAGNGNKKKKKEKFRRMLSGYKMVDKSEKQQPGSNKAISGLNITGSGNSRGFGVGSLFNGRQSNMTATTVSTSLTASNLSSSMNSTMSCSQYQKMKNSRRNMNGRRRSSVESYNTWDSTHSMPSGPLPQSIWRVGIGGSSHGMGDTTHSMPAKSSQSMWGDVSNRSGDINESYHSMNIAPKRPSDPRELSQQELEDLRQRGGGVSSTTMNQDEVSSPKDLFTAGTEDHNASFDNDPQDEKQLYQPFPNAARSLLPNLDPSSSFPSPPVSKDNEDEKILLNPSKIVCSKEIAFGQLSSSSHPHPNESKEDEGHDPETSRPSDEVSFEPNPTFALSHSSSPMLPSTGSRILHTCHPEDNGHEEEEVEDNKNDEKLPEEMKDTSQDVMRNEPLVRYDPHLGSSIASMPMVMSLMLGENQSHEDNNSGKSGYDDATEKKPLEIVEHERHDASNDSFCAVKSFEADGDDDGEEADVRRDEINADLASHPKVLALMLGEDDDGNENGGIDASNRSCLAVMSFEASVLGGEKQDQDDVVGGEAIRRESEGDSNGVDVSNRAVKSFNQSSDDDTDDYDESGWKNWLPWPTKADDDGEKGSVKQVQDVTKEGRQKDTSANTKRDKDSEDWTTNSIHSLQSTAVELGKDETVIKAIGVLEGDDGEDSYVDGDEAWLPWPNRMEEDLPDGVPRVIELTTDDDSRERRPSRCFGILLKGVLGHSQ